MENKIILYNSSGAKIGETYPRRAKQLINQQRAMWTDDTQTAIRFAPGMEHMGQTTGHSPPGEFIPAPNQLCFAPWEDQYYYPAVINNLLPGRISVVFLDTYESDVLPEHVLSLEEGFEMLDFQCKYSWLGFYDGVITSREPIVFQFDDGIIQQVALNKLRGLRRFF